jgi:hypothetical protein
MPSPTSVAAARALPARVPPGRASLASADDGTAALAALELAARALALRCRASGVPPMEALARVTAVTLPARRRAAARERGALTVTVFGAFLGAYYGPPCARQVAPRADGGARRTCSTRRPPRPARENVP